MANVITNLGEEWAVDRLVGSGTYSAFTGAYVGWGTGTTGAAKADTSVETEVAVNTGTDAYVGRVSGTITKTGTGAAAKWQNIAILTSTATQTIANAGTYSINASTGVLFLHGNFTGIPLGPGDSIQFTFTLDPA